MICKVQRSDRLLNSLIRGSLFRQFRRHFRGIDRTPCGPIQHGRYLLISRLFRQVR